MTFIWLFIITLFPKARATLHYQCCEKNFKIGVFKVCGIDFKDPLLWRQRSATATAVVQTTLPYTGENLWSQFRRLWRPQSWKFLHRISSIYVWNIILDVTEWFVTHDTLGGVDESQKCISTGPYERFYGLKMLCKRIFLKNLCCGR